MQLAKTYSISLYGMTGRAIEIEADISSNLPGFVLVGLPDASLQEASARVRAAITNSGFTWPNRKVTVNLSPANVPKSGSSFDLAIAAAILAASGQIELTSGRVSVALGELALDGQVKPVPGVLPALREAQRMRFRRALVPRENFAEAQLISDLDVSAVGCLVCFARKISVAEITQSCQCQIELAQGGQEDSNASGSPSSETALDFFDVLGQQSAIRALAVAAVGRHHALMVGPPGAGKTMLAERLPSILPPLDAETAVDLASIRSLVRLGQFSLIPDGEQATPFCAPHHSVNQTAMIGGGNPVPRPGQISLAHGGVLFLDEAPEFSLSTLESLREPLESGSISISRAAGTAVFPARFQLVMAANPCPCGYRDVPGKTCTCSYSARARYASKLSGPLLDRIDIRIRVDAQTKAARLRAAKTERCSSLTLRQQVAQARNASAERLAGTPWRFNSEVSGQFLRRLATENPSATAILERALVSGSISMRGFDRCMRVALSIADLDAKPVLDATCVAEALFLRGASDWSAL